MQQTLEGARLLTEVSQRGYAEFEHGISKDMIETAIGNYALFTSNHPDPLPETMDAMLPPTDSVAALKNELDTLDRSADTQAEWHKYRTNTAQVAKPDGYTSRIFQDRALRITRGSVIPPEDPKEYYHYTPGHYSAMKRNHREFGWGLIPPEAYQLDTSIGPIHRMATELMLKTCSLIEETHPEIGNFITRKSLITSPVRILFYHPDDHETLGAGHYDKGALTIQIAESHEGLRVAPNKEQPLQPVVRNASKAVIFPGDGMRDLDPQTLLQPGWHDIVKINRLNEGRSLPLNATEVCARWAMIFFANQVNYVQPDKALMHTR